MKSSGLSHAYSVLYVEDDPSSFARTAKMLNKLSFFLYVAENGREGLRIFHEINPDIVITNINLPVMSGLDMARQIRKCNEDIPIIATLSPNDTDLLLSSFDIGISNYLLKPFNYESFESVILRSIKTIEIDQILSGQKDQASLLLEVIERSPSMVTITDHEGHIQFTNSLGALSRGFDRNELLGKHFSVLFSKSSGNSLKELSDAISKGIKWDGELSIEDVEGNSFTEFTNISPVLDQSGAISYFIIFSEDITNKKEAAEEIRKLNSELEYRVLRRTALLDASNRELEDFCDVISHELCGPISRLQGLSKALCEDLSDSINDSVKDYLQRIIQTSQQLKYIIDTLLNLSQLSRRGVSLQDVNLSSIANSIFNNLKSSAPGRNIKFYVAPDIQVKGDHSLLQIVMENLLKNAWKCTENHFLSQIEFGIARSNGKAVYFVRDNGCGFDMKYSNKLFKLFHNINAPHEVSFNGTELATAQRIIQRHGGRIWAEGEPGKGATFYFTL